MSDTKTKLVDALKAWLPEHGKEQDAMFHLGQMVRELWLQAVSEKAASKRTEKAEK